MAREKDEKRPRKAGLGEKLSQLYREGIDQIQPASDPSDQPSGLKAELDALLGKGCEELKIPPAPNHPVRTKFIAEIMDVGGGKLTKPGLAWGRKHLGEMPPLVKGTPTAQPVPFAIAEQMASVDKLEPYPPVDGGTELIVLPVGRDMMMARMKGWKGRDHARI